MSNTFTTENNVEFQTWLVNHKEVQGAAVSLREDYFETWFGNNFDRFVREFNRRTK